MEATRRSTATFHLDSDEVAYVEACLARRRELLALALDAPNGHVLAQCEEATVEAARQYGHALLTDALAKRIALAEQKKSDPHESVNAGGGDTAEDPTTATF
jgi:hypothetical protein